MRLIEQMATEEKIRDNHSRWIALLPFGVGQFQNGQKTLGAVFLGTEVALLVGAAVAFPFYVYNRGRGLNYYGTDPNADPLKTYRERANTASVVNGVLNVAFAITAVAGIVHAQYTYVPYVDETRRRPLPKVSNVTPLVAPSRGGGVLGLEGEF